MAELSADQIVVDFNSVQQRLDCSETFEAQTAPRKIDERERRS